MHTRSASVYRQPSPMKKPLLRMLRWLSVAPFGNPVVPLVYWMLIGVVAVEGRCARFELVVADGFAGGDELVPVVRGEEHDSFEAG